MTLPRLLARHWPLAAALLLLWALLGGFLVASMRQNDGLLIYGLDDAYIHMAMAKHAALGGVLGVTPYEWSSSSSSLAWTLLLAGGFRAVGVWEGLPLLLNGLAASGLLLLVDRLLASAEGSLAGARVAEVELLQSDAASAGRVVALRSPAGWGGWYRLAVLVGFILLVPLPALAFTGMEHTLQALVNLLFFALAVEAVATGGRRATRALLLVAPLVTLVRYEGLFLVLPVALALALRRRVGAAGSLVGLAGLPLAIYGAISVAQGWSALPNSVLLKGFVDWRSPVEVAKVLSGYRVAERLNQAGAIESYGFVLLVVLGLTLWVARYERGRFWAAPQVSLTLLGAVAVLHLLFARANFRYAAYLIALGLWVVAQLGQGWLFRARPTLRFGFDTALVPRYIGMAALALVALALPAARGANALAETVQATTNIYEQQVQMARFLAAHYEGESVAANDIGAINFFADIRCLDLWGLAARDAARYYRTRTYTTDAIRQMTAARGTVIAVVYDHWFRLGRSRDGRSILPPEWVKVGEWTIANNVIAGGPTVAFYAVRPAETARLATTLRAFADELPPTVRQSGPYTEMAADE